MKKALKNTVLFLILVLIISLILNLQLVRAQVTITEVNGVTLTSTDEIDLGEVADRKSVNVTLKQGGDVASGATVVIEPITTDMSWAFEPGAWGTGTMQPNEEKTFAFDIVDLTTTETTKGQFKLTITDILGSLLDSVTFEVTLLPRGIDEVLLHIKTVDKTTGLDVSGIKVVMTNNELMESEEAFAPATFDFEGTIPYVSVTVPETDAYYSASQSKQLEFGENTIILELVPRKPDKQEEPLNWTLIIIALIFAAAIIISVAIFAKYRKK